MADSPSFRQTRAGVAANSIWGAVDQVVALVGGTVSSILVARSFHPDILGNYSYIMWLVMIAGSLGRFGTPLAVRKYMLEMFAANEDRMAIRVFQAILMAQFGLAILFTAGGLLVAWYSVPPQFRAFAVVGILAIAPSMLTSAYTNANMAVERFAPNVIASLVSMLVNFAGIAATVLWHWGLIGLSGSLVVSRIVDLAVRATATHRQLPPLEPFWPRPIWAAIPVDLRDRILRFCAQSTFLQLMTMIVWERSEVIFLKWYSPVREITFYSMAFSLVQQASTLQRSFTSAAGVNLMRKVGSSPEQVAQTIREILRYSGIIALPLAAGLAATSPALIRVMYGQNYLPVIPVLAVAAAFGLARALLMPLEQVLIASDRQDLLIRSSLIASVVNVAFALLFIPQLGAFGAAICNGLSQVAGIFLTRWMVRKVVPFQVPVGSLLRNGAVSAVLAAVVFGVVSLLPPPLGLAAGVLAGLLVYVPLTRGFHALEPEDYPRFRSMAARLPSFARPPAFSVLAFMTRKPAGA
jgi:O-antigen/teichoic acid export membrane protein